jgi:hypothetical protein
MKHKFGKVIYTFGFLVSLGSYLLTIIRFLFSYIDNVHLVRV